jgi:CheY-like chemotaxis protein
MSGFHLAQRVRTIRPALPIIMTSGDVRQEDQARATDMGLGRIILKPNTVDELGRELDARCAQLRVTL